MYKCVNLLPLTLNLHAQHTATVDLNKEKERKLTGEPNNTPMLSMLPYEQRRMRQLLFDRPENKIVCVPKHFLATLRNTVRFRAGRQCQADLGSTSEHKRNFFPYIFWTLTIRLCTSCARRIRKYVQHFKCIFLHSNTIHKFSTVDHRRNMGRVIHCRSIMNYRNHHILHARTTLLFTVNDFFSI